MKYVLALSIMFLGCTGWGGYGYGYGQSPSYLPPVAYGAAGYGGGYGYGGYVAPPPPPPGLAFVNGHGMPEVWRNSPHDVEVINNTDFYVRIRQDGQEIAFIDLYVSVPPLVPPRSSAHYYVPLAGTDLRTGCEHHNLEFESYLAPDLSQPVQRTGEDYVFCAGWDHQTVRLGGF